MVLALDLLILFLFSICILSIFQTAKNVQGWMEQRCERCRRGGRRSGESINKNIKACVFVHFVRC